MIKRISKKTILVYHSVNESDNKTLDLGLPRFCDCIDNTVDHGVKKKKDPSLKRSLLLTRF